MSPVRRSDAFYAYDLVLGNERIPMNKKIYKIIANCGGIGLVPIAPGTVASSVIALLLYAVAPLSLLTQIILLNLLFLIGTIASEHAENDSNKKDPSFIVIDEFFGMTLALFAAPKIWWIYVLAFVIFRFFDILKPGPIGILEKKVPGGLGIMLDDALAGLVTMLIVQVTVNLL